MWKRFVFGLTIAMLAISCKTEHRTEEKALSRQTQTGLRFVGSQNCAACHQAEYALWMGSDHQLSMQEANDKTVLGDFNNTSFDYYGIHSTFYKSGNKFFVRTDGPDRKLQDYQIRYAFGVRPLQQYLIEFNGGRYQALSIFWDTRPASEGGKKWAHLYPGERIDSKDVLHWTGIYQNWNHMCAECHSTNLHKNFKESENHFETTWSEINVACESCHGPGSGHVAWLKQKNRAPLENFGFAVSLRRRRNDFPIDHSTGNPVRINERVTLNSQVEACAECHSRRTAIRDPYVHGRPLLDTHLPVLLEENLYYPDGQISDEVYEYGSFLQSKMFTQGVSCTNCHDPHSTRLYVDSRRICSQCHMPEKYDSPTHHFHKMGSAGADCRNCHMPARNYMVVDPRRDHSFRIPRPDLSVKLGTPNACNECHKDRAPQWAAQKIQQRFPRRMLQAQFGETIAPSRSYQVNSEPDLRRLLEDSSVAGIVRATALRELQGTLTSDSLQAVALAAKDPDPLVRLAALDAMQSTDYSFLMAAAFPLLKDPLLGIRIKAVGIISNITYNSLSKEQQEQFDAAGKEYLEVQKINADRPDAQLNLGVFYANTRHFSQAEAAYKRAIQIQPSFIEAYINLADLYRVEGSDAKGRMELETALKLEPSNAEAHYALGLLLVRMKLLNEAFPHFAEAAKQSSNPHYSYTYGIALQSAGRIEEALAFLKSSSGRFPASREILYALISISRDSGDISTAREFTEKLYRMFPDERVTKTTQ